MGKRLLLLAVVVLNASMLFGAWDISSIDAGDSQEGVYTALAVDAECKVHVAYTEAIDADLKYAYFNGVSWSTATIDTDWNQDDVSIAIDSSNRPHIAYCNYDSVG